jgi:penicillin-binding protein 2
VHEIENAVSRQRMPVADHALQALPQKAADFDVVRRAMHGVTQEGTSTRVFIGAPYASGGKTGTAQAVGLKQNEKYNASRIEEHQRDHSLYVAFAPLEAPTVALAVVVENAGFGAVAAAPIARRVFDYLLLDQWPSDEDIIATQTGKSTVPIGTPRRASDVILPGSIGGAAPAASAPAGIAQAQPVPRLALAGAPR